MCSMPFHGNMSQEPSHNWCKFNQNPNATSFRNCQYDLVIFHHQLLQSRLLLTQHGKARYVYILTLNRCTIVECQNVTDS